MKGQESLNHKYDLLIEGSETYQQFKVIPKSDLSDFWKEVNDTLSVSRGIAVDLQVKLEEQQGAIKDLEAKLDNVQAELDSSLETNDSINFLGILFSKGGYHLFVWGIIIVLAVTTALCYMMFLRSNRVTTKAKREYEDLSLELVAYKDKAREAQVKLKRELQTALNKLSERRV
ncbi:MAG: hypothetical protein HRT61_14600 [Ekhidna sp.]|nr:hypothetical protein [Ekhidna sp.]